MNYRLIFKHIGALCLLEAGAMLPALGVEMFCGQGEAAPFVKSVAILIFLGFLMYKIKPQTDELRFRDGFALVGIGWLLVSLAGSLPYIFSGAAPMLPDAFFESVSGFSTTGASILRKVEGLPRGVVFWRSTTNWLGGVGVLVLIIAILPAKASTLHIMQAENTGPVVDKFMPRIGQMAKTLCLIYIVLTAALAAVLVACGLPLYDSAVHAMSTAGTGGFSSRDASIAAYRGTNADIVIFIFMLVFSFNFSLYHKSLNDRGKSLLNDEELRGYLLCVIIAIALIAANLAAAGVYRTLGEAVRYAAFQVSSVVTTTGFATADFNLWPVFSKTLLLILMLTGGCTGSTAGGLKFMRVLLLFKIMRREIGKIIRPHAVQVVRFGGKTIEEGVLFGVLTYFALYCLIFILVTLIVALDGHDLETCASAALSTLGNIGPGLGMVGPAGNYADFSAVSKIAMSFCMLLGRIEIYPLALLCSPALWRRTNM
ncbi:MAG: TrkH family potassium uptake protein [Acidaminococcales bacterium]|jgi:trk system potassium uptake protein TrkH|nr:TrkH family potassium uptake protein [Acidaminococcales bacterium]